MLNQKSPCTPAPAVACAVARLIVGALEHRQGRVHGLRRWRVRAGFSPADHARAGRGATVEQLLRRRLQGHQLAALIQHQAGADHRASRRGRVKRRVLGGRRVNPCKASRARRSSACSASLNGPSASRWCRYSRPCAAPPASATAPPWTSACAKARRCAHTTRLACRPAPRTAGGATLRRAHHGHGGLLGLRLGARIRRPQQRSGPGRKASVTMLPEQSVRRSTRRERAESGLNALAQRVQHRGHQHVDGIRQGSQQGQLRQPSPCARMGSRGPSIGGSLISGPRQISVWAGCASIVFLVYV